MSVHRNGIIRHIKIIVSVRQQSVRNGEERGKNDTLGVNVRKEDDRDDSEKPKKVSEEDG